MASIPSLSSKIAVVDVFCGAAGLSYGLKASGIGPPPEKWSALNSVF